MNINRSTLYVVLLVALVVLAVLGAVLSQQQPESVQAVSVVTTAVPVTPAVEHVYAHVQYVHNKTVDQSVPYADACHTFYTWAPTGGVESIYGVGCAVSAPVVIKHNDKDISVAQVIIETVVATLTDVPDTSTSTPTAEVTSTPVPTNTPIVVVVDPTSTPAPVVESNCNNGAGNGDNCTPGNSSGSNQGNGQQTGDQTNQGENGNKKDK